MLVSVKRTLFADEEDETVQSIDWLQMHYEEPAAYEEVHTHQPATPAISAGEVEDQTESEEEEAEVAPQLPLAVLPSAEAKSALKRPAADSPEGPTRSKRSRKAPPPRTQQKFYFTRRQAAAKKAALLSSAQLSLDSPPHLKVQLHRLTNAELEAYCVPVAEAEDVTSNEKVKSTFFANFNCGKS